MMALQLRLVEVSIISIEFRGCALGRGGPDGDGVISAPPSGATTSVLAPAVQQHLAGAGGEVTNLNLKGRE